MKLTEASGIITNDAHVETAVLNARKGVEPVLQIIDSLRDQIATGTLLPNERLIEADLATALSTNRANIRTALVVLEAEGLVTREANRGARVRLISEKEATELATIRIVLEGLVAREAALNVQPAGRALLEDISRDMAERYADGDFLRVSQINTQLHGAILKMCPNETLVRMMSNLKQQLIRLQYRTILVPGRFALMVKEHQRIIDAICHQDGDEAEQAMRDHLASVLDNLHRSFSTVRFTGAS